MKRTVLCLLLITALLLTCSACKKQNDTLSDSDTSGTVSDTVKDTEKETETTPAETTGQSDTAGTGTGTEQTTPSTGTTPPSTTNPPATNPPTTPPTVKTCDHSNTEVRNKKDATTSSEGYTGDTYCKDCGKLISSGSSIPKIKQTISTSHDYYDAEMRVFNDINAERAKAGLNALIWDEALYAGTKVRVNEFYDWACGKHNAGPHNRPNGDKSYTAMWEYDNGTLKPFTYYGENCIGTSDYGEFASEWMDSDSHRPQILSEKYTRTAIAIIYCSDGLYYATQFFVG